MLRPASLGAAWALASIAAGLAVGALTTPGVASASLPEGRAYELVSPPDKNGADVGVNAARTRAAAGESPQSPMAATFMSLGGFADVRGTGITTEYFSERDLKPGTSGWTTHAITPPQTPMSVLGAVNLEDPLYEGELSSDLSRGVFRAWSPVTDAPDVADVENLYLRSDLRSAGAGAYELLTGSVALLPPSTIMPALAGASSDFRTVAFESKYSLTADAGGCVPSSGGTGCAPKLYVAVDGVVRLAGILPNGAPAGTGCPGGLPCSIAGQGASGAGSGLSARGYTPRTVSSDGALVLFSSPVTANGGPTSTSSTGANATKIYLRDDHGTADESDDTTLQVNASERTDCAGDPTCGGDGIPDPAPATARRALLWGGSTDLSRVFFTSSEALTDDAPNTTGVDHLYMWQADAPAGHHLTMLDVDQNPGDAPGAARGVIGTSEDGHYVYFLANGQLVAGAPTGIGLGIYAWHDEAGTPAVDYVGRLNLANTDIPRDVQSSWNFNPTEARVTPDGKHLVFASSDGSGLLSAHGGVDYDQSCNGVSCRELYVYSLDSHELACASCNPNGAPSTVAATDNVSLGPGSGPVKTSHLSHAISDDGSHFFFSTAEALVPEDTNGKVDAYELDVPGGTDLAHATLHLLSSGTDTSGSYFADASASGHDAFIVTRQRLTGWDTDSSYDLYDARIGGGVPDPSPPAPDCAGDVCQGSPGVGPASAPAASSLFNGLGNLPGIPKAKPKAKPKPCKRGFVRRKVMGKARCVKRRTAHKATHAAAKRRAK